MKPGDDSCFFMWAREYQLPCAGLLLKSQEASKGTEMCASCAEAGAEKSADLLEAAMEALEERLARLEEAAFFQEERLKELDSALSAQQTQLDAIERQLADLRALVRSLRDKLADSPEQTLPPHFMPERY